MLPVTHGGNPGRTPDDLALARKAQHFNRREGFGGSAQHAQRRRAREPSSVWSARRGNPAELRDTSGDLVRAGQQINSAERLSASAGSRAALAELRAVPRETMLAMWRAARPRTPALLSAMPSALHARLARANSARRVDDAERAEETPLVRASSFEAQRRGTIVSRRAPSLEARN